MDTLRHAIHGDCHGRYRHSCVTALLQANSGILESVTRPMRQFYDCCENRIRVDRRWYLDGLVRGHLTVVCGAQTAIITQVENHRHGHSWLGRCGKHGYYCSHALFEVLSRSERQTLLVPSDAHNITQLTPADWNGHITIWCLLESGIGIIASSLPALRSLFMKYIESSRYGSGNKSTGMRSGSKPLEAVGGSSHKPSIPLDTLTSDGVSGQWNRLEDDASSKGIIVQEKTFNIEYESLSDGEPRYDV